MEEKYSVVVKDAEAHIVMGAVYVPMSVDSDNEAMTPEDIRKMAHEFLSSGKVNKIDKSHNFQESGCLVVESSLARAGDPDFVEGTWIVTTKITDPAIWEQIQKGEINGYSFAGIVRKEVSTVLIETIDTMSGYTEDSTIDILPVHKHDFFMKFNDNGRISVGKTSIFLGHEHTIKAVDATEMEMGHAHRIIS